MKILLPVWVALLSTAALVAQSTITFSDGVTSTAAINTAAPNSPATLLIASGTATHAGWFSGSGGVIKAGAGTLTLAADDSDAYLDTGPIIVSAGTLRLNAALLETGLISVESGAILDLQRQDIFGQHLGNTGRHIIIEAGGLVTNGNFFNTFTGLTLKGGELRASNGHDGTWPAYQLKGTVTVGGTSASSITTTGAVNSQVQIGNNTAGGSTTFQVAEVTGGSAADLTISAVLENGRSSPMNDFASVASGLVKTGAGTLTLSGANTYTGNTTVSAGTLRLENTLYNAGTAAGVVTVGAGATLDLQAEAIFGGHLANSNARIVIEAGGLVTNGNVFNTLNNLTLNGGELRVGGYSLDTYSAYHLKGTVTVSGTSASTITAAEGYEGFKILIGNYTNGGATTFDVADATASPAADLIISAGLTESYNDSNWFPSDLIKTGAGTLTFLGAHSTTVTRIMAGTVEIGDGVKTGTVYGKLISAAGAFVGFNVSEGSSQYGGDIYGEGTVIKRGAGTQYLGVLALAGQLRLSAGTLVLAGGWRSGVDMTGVLRVESGATLDLQSLDTFGQHMESPASRLIIEAGGLVTNGDVFNTFTNLTLNGGELRANGGAAETYPAYQLKGTVTAGGSSASSITTTGAANSQIQLGNNTAGGFTTFQVTNVTGNPSADLTISAVLQDGRNATDEALVASGLVKTGAGTLLLTGANTYTGPTTVAAGTLRLDGSASASIFTVDSGATLGGTGTVGGLTLGGTLSPGNSPGTLSVDGNASWNGGANYVWEINDAASPATGAGTRYDLLSISGTLTIAAIAGNKFTLTLVSLLADNTTGDVVNFNSAVNSSYTIATTTGGIFGFDANAFTINSTGFTNGLAGGSWNLALANSNRDLTLNFTAATAIPEPSTYAMLAGVVVLGLAVYCRRKSQHRP